MHRREQPAQPERGGARYIAWSGANPQNNKPSAFDGVLNWAAAEFPCKNWIVNWISGMNRTLIVFATAAALVVGGRTMNKTEQRATSGAAIGAAGGAIGGAIGAGVGLVGGLPVDQHKKFQERAFQRGYNEGRGGQ